MIKGRETTNMLNHRLLVRRTYGERPMLHIGLHCDICELASNKSLGVKDGICWVHGHLVLSGVTDETLCVGESDI